jgi:hypothetical protein
MNARPIMGDALVDRPSRYIGQIIQYWRVDDDWAVILELSNGRTHATLLSRCVPYASKSPRQQIRLVTVDGVLV